MEGSLPWGCLVEASGKSRLGCDEVELRITSGEGKEGERENGRKKREKVRGISLVGGVGGRWGGGFIKERWD